MSSSPKWSTRKRRRLVELYQEQNGECYYCRRIMDPGPFNGRVPPENGATIEHLIPRYAGRIRKQTLKDTVAACRKCNQDRAVAERKNL